MEGAHHGGEVLPQLRIIWHGLLVRIVLVSVAVMSLCRVAIFRRAGCRGWIMAVAGTALVCVRLLVERETRLLTWRRVALVLVLLLVRLEFGGGVGLGCGR